MKYKTRAPLPGANYTSDTRNYAWHRPPDITDYDEGVEYIMERIGESDEQMETIYAMLGIDTPITTIVNVLLLQGIAKGKFSIDLAIMMAGPVARYIEILAKQAEVKYDLGIDDTGRIPVTPTTLKLALGIMDDEDEEEMALTPPVESTEMGEGGFMSLPTTEEDTPAPESEQAAMLGMIEEDDADELA